MSSRHESGARTIHPHTLAELGEEACIVALGVARDLRSGVIPPEKYDQRRWCGTACCIGGHIATRLGKTHNVLMGEIWDRCGDDLFVPDLFSGRHPSNPILAADAIERYIMLGSTTPWTVP